LIESIHHATNTDGIGVSLLAGIKQYVFFIYIFRIILTFNRSSVSDTRALAALDQYLVSGIKPHKQDTTAINRKQKRLKANNSNDQLDAVGKIQ
jgi:hypothetical protein